MCFIPSNLPVTCIRSLSVGGIFPGDSKIVVLLYKVVQILPGLIVCKQAAISTGHI
jgi:hypothetical protein